MFKRELENLEIKHNASVIIVKQGHMIDFSLLLFVAFAMGVVSFSIVSTYRNGDIVWLIVDIVLMFVNAFNFVFTIRRMVRRHKRSKELQELYEEARQELLKLCEFEEDGYEVVLE